jgi:hypothetical protein
VRYFEEGLLQEDDDVVVGLDREEMRSSCCGECILPWDRRDGIYTYPRSRTGITCELRRIQLAAVIQPYVSDGESYSHESSRFCWVPEATLS